MGFSRLCQFCYCPPCSSFFRRTGLSALTWAQFVGRFHLLTVHFPIALILLMPVLELAGRKRRLPPSARLGRFRIGAGNFEQPGGCNPWMVPGRSGGYSGRLVTQHMWGGVSVAAVCWLCWMLRGCFRGPRLDFDLHVRAAGRGWARIVDGISRRPTVARRKSPHRTNARRTAQVGWAFGELQKLCPDRILLISMARMWNPSSPSTATPATVRRSRNRACGWTVMQALMRGGKHGPVIKAGNAKGSELFRRVTLPPSDDDAMPAARQAPLVGE